MKLTHDSEQDIWQFIQGDSVIPLDGERTFSEREQAVAIARKVGLTIDKAGNVMIAGPSPGARKKASKSRRSDFSQEKTDLQQNRRITLWLDNTSITRLDQLAQTYGSRGEAVRWLLSKTAID